MEKIINYVLVPSLEHIALVKIVTLLWNREDVRALIEKFEIDFYSNYREIWQKIENKVMEKVSLLPQPGSLKERMSGVIKPISLEIFDWISDYPKGKWSLAVSRPVEFGWTPQGTLDRKKTAETLIQNETIDIRERYRLACVYCLKNAVEALWEKMPENYKGSFYSVQHVAVFHQHKLIIFWTCDINGELDKFKIQDITRMNWRNCTPYQYAFDYAVFHKNKVAAEYFLNKQTPEEREESLSIQRWNLYICDSNDFDGFCFLFLLMNEEQQRIVIEKNASRLLLCFLNWPRQGLFMEMANCVGHFLDSKDYCDVFGKIVTKIIDGFIDYDYQNLFEKFWKQSLMTHKKYVINRGIYNGLLGKLFEVKAKKNISLIFKDATLKEKEDIIFSYLGINICQGLAYSNEWDFLMFFISECISTQEKMIKFKEECKKRVIWSFLIDEKEAKWKFFQFLDDLILKGDKRRDTEDKNCTPAKKLCRSFK